MLKLSAFVTASAMALTLSLGACKADTPKPDTKTMQPVKAADYQSGWISVTQTGSGPDVILIPGLASSADVWNGTVDNLKNSHRLHVVQVAGFAGATSPTEARTSVIDGLTSDLSDYINAEGLDAPIVAGHSLGGFTGLKMARDYGEQIGGVVIVDSLPFYSALFNPDATAESSGPYAERMAAQMKSASKARYDAMQRQGAKIYSKNKAAQNRIGDWSAASDRDIVIASMTELMTTDMRPDLKKIDVPVTVIYAHDPQMGMPAEQMSALYEGQYKDLKGAQLTRIDSSYHFIMDDQPEAFYNALETALEGE